MAKKTAKKSIPKSKRTKEWLRRSAAAKKGWETRRAIAAKKKRAAVKKHIPLNPRIQPKPKTKPKAKPKSKARIRPKAKPKVKPKTRIRPKPKAKAKPKTSAELRVELQNAEVREEQEAAEKWLGRKLSKKEKETFWWTPDWESGFVKNDGTLALTFSRLRYLGKPGEYPSAEYLERLQHAEEEGRFDEEAYLIAEESGLTPREVFGFGKSP